MCKQRVDARHCMTDTVWSQTLAMSTLCSGELKTAGMKKKGKAERSYLNRVKAKRPASTTLPTSDLPHIHYLPVTFNHFR